MKLNVSTVIRVTKSNDYCFRNICFYVGALSHELCAVCVCVCACTCHMPACVHLSFNHNGKTPTLLECSRATLLTLMAEVAQELPVTFLKCDHAWRSGWDGSRSLGCRR
jgi:hypothetical protein